MPRGVRPASADDLPTGLDTATLDRLARVQLRTGFITHVRPTDAGSTAFIEANVHAPSLWQVFHDLVDALLPPVCAPIVGVDGEEPILGPYTQRELALAALEPHHEALQHDGFLEFGAIFQYEGRTEEVFVRAAKYVQIWTNEPQVAAAVFARHGIPAAATLEFVDELPHTSETLQQADGNAGWPRVIDAVRAAFDMLPVVAPDA